MDSVTIVSACIAAASLLFAFVTLLKNVSKDGGENAARQTAVETKLDYIGEDVKDIKADMRSFQRDLDNTKATAEAALHRADAAHDRLDAIGAKSAHVSRAILEQGGNNE